MCSVYVCVYITTSVPCMHARTVKIGSFRRRISASHAHALLQTHDTHTHTYTLGRITVITQNTDFIV
jgi:hypothetical protein